MATRPAQIDNGPSATGRNQWTYEQRVCLHLLSTHERQLSRAQRAMAFNRIYKDHLIACGVPPPGLKKTSIDGQYAERNHQEKSSWRNLWRDVLTPPDTATDRALRERLRAKIASVLGYDGGEITEVAGPIRPRTPPDPPPPQHRNRLSEPMTPAEDPYARVYNTPNTSSRKRPAVTLTTTLTEDNMFQEDNNYGNEDDEEYLPRAKIQRANSPFVTIPPTPKSLVRQTRKKVISPGKHNKARAARAQRATEQYNRRIGDPLWLTPEERDEAVKPLSDVSEEAAHPTPPALLYRYWSPRSHGINSKEGFMSGKASKALVEPRGPPDCKNLDFNDVAHHLNNGGDDQKSMPSPFISTSNLLVWAIRRTLKRADPDACISVIDTSKLDPKSIFWVPPFYKELKKKRPFTEGYFNYCGTYEHLVWHEIPGPAVIRTFKVADFITFSKTSKALSSILRLDQLAASKSSAPDIIKLFRQDAVRISRNRVAHAIGQTVLFLGLDHTASSAQLSRAVYEIAQGWSLQADGISQDKADSFVKAFSDKSAISMAQHAKLHQAFLQGIEWSCGDLNMHLKGPEAQRLMKSRASKRGLDDVGQIMARRLSGARREVTLFAREQGRLQLPPVERLAIENRQVVEVEDDVMEEEDEDEVTNGLDHLDLEEYIHYE